MIPEHFRLKNTIKYPTSLIVGGLSRLGLEIADSLIEQGGYVIIADTYSEENINKLNIFSKETLVSFIDYTTLANLDEDLRRLDYIFYFNHESMDYMSKISTQDFLRFSNYLDTALSLANKMDAKFLLSTAIRAHQLSLTYDDLSVKYGINSSERHTVYTEMEVQRYAESLVMEYVEKTKLDARIIRLGEIIGEGIDFATKNFFNDLMIDVAKHEPIRLSKDGLESEWMVHLMDAAYGIIKAEFSKDTSGKLFSIAYPNPFTHLSIAYKVQELDGEAKEIQFIDKGDNLPEIRLYKPAPNLSVIGWAPKIPIEKAIMQSIAAAKIYLMENQNLQNPEDSSNVVNKLRGFLTLADKAPEVKDDYGGPISRLIAERKHQEELKMQSITNSNETARQKGKKPKTMKEKTTNKLWNFSLGFGNTFGMFKNKSPGELLFSFIVLGIVVAFFIFVFAPVISIGKDVLAIMPFYNTALTAVEGNSYDASSLHADVISNSLKNMNTNLESLTGLVNLFGLSSEYQQLHSAISAYSTLTDGMNDIQYATDPFYQYLDSFKNNTSVATGSDADTTGYLTTNASTTDYSQNLSDLQSRLPYLESGIQKYQKGIDQANALNYEQLPGFLTDKLVALNFRLKQDESFINSLDAMKYLPEILGLNQSRTYLILVEDNTRLKPVGGEIAASVLITLKNGVITNTSVQSPDQINFDYKDIPSNVLNEINERNFTSVSNSDLNYLALGNIYSYDDYSIAVTNLYQTTLSNNISGVLTLNYNTFSDLLELLNENNLGVTRDSTVYTGKDLLTQMDQTLAGAETIPNKHKLTAELSASTLNSLLSNIKGLFPQVLTVLNSGFINQNVLLSTQNLSYAEYVQNNNLDNNSISLTNTGYSIGYNVLDTNAVSIDTNPVFTVQESDKVDSKDNLTYKLNLTIPSIGNAQELSVCLPLIVPDSGISVTGIESTNVAINSGLDQKCIVAELTQEKALEFDWSYKANLTADTSNNYEVELPSKNIRGATSFLTKTIVLEPDLKLQGADPYAALQNNTLIYTQNSGSDFDVKVQYSKL